jgi:hypothetical protein
MNRIPTLPELDHSDYQTLGIGLLAESLHYVDLDLDTLVELHNQFSENDWAADGHLSIHMLDHPLLKAAIAGINNGVIVEIGPHRSITLDQLAKQYGTQLPGTLVIGIDKSRFFGDSLAPIQFSYTIPQTLFDTEKKLGKSVLNPECFNNHYRICHHSEHPNTFAVYGHTAEKVLLPEAKLDLVILKCMMGYLGSTPSESLEYFKKGILPRAESVFMLDYIGQCRFTKVNIPQPKAIAVEIGKAFSSSRILIQQENNYFMLYAER